MWRVFGELSFKEIGDLYSKTDNWACVTYHRARKLIQSRLEAVSYTHLHRHEGHAGGTKSRGTAPQGCRPTGPAGTGQAPRPGAGAVKGTVFCRPLYEKLSTFTHGKEIAL